MRIKFEFGFRAIESRIEAVEQAVHLFFGRVEIKSCMGLFQSGPEKNKILSELVDSIFFVRFENLFFTVLEC
jgi:hypothetical protein